LEFYNKCNHLMKELYESNPRNIGLLEDFGISYYKLAMMYKAKGDNTRGKEYYKELKKITFELARNFPQISKYKQMNQVRYEDL